MGGPSLTAFFCAVQLLLQAFASVVAEAAAEGANAPDVSTKRRNSMTGYFDTEGQEDDEDLIHIPLRSRASVLRERNLLHLLEEERDEEASATFARWAARGGRHGRSLRTSDPDDLNADVTNHDARILQEFSGEGTHFIDAYVGTPAQKRVLAVSSGADFTAFPCEGCTKCGPIISPYRHTFSTSFISMPCGRCVGGQREDVCDSKREKCIARGFNLVDKSAWTAYEARDYVYVGGAEAEIEQRGVANAEGTDVPEKHGFPLVFACQTEATGWYSSQVQDGIVGFSTARTSFVNQMVFQDQLKHPRFCMCFEQKILRGDDFRSAGVVTLGGYNPRILDAPLVYVQNMEDEGTRYKVHVRSIYFRQGGGQSIVPDRDGQAVVRLNFDEQKFNEKNGGTILDSGVPLIIFDEGVQRSFLAEWEKMVGSPFTFGKMLLTENDVKALPTLIVQIKAHEGVDKSFDPRTMPNMAGDRDPQHPFDALLAIPATHYMEYNPSTGTYRAKIALDSRIGSFLGINAMQGHAFFYDLGKDRIGFAESFNCQPKLGPAGIVDDDMFELPTVHIETEGFENPTGPIDGGMPDGLTTPKGGPEENDRGSCVTATCISFVTVGYCIVIIAMAVAYRKWRPRDRSKQIDQPVADDLTQDETAETEMLTPVFDPHVRGNGSSRSSTRGGMLA